MLVILALGRLRQEDFKFEANLGNIGRPCLKNKQTKSSQTNKQTKATTNNLKWNEKNQNRQKMKNEVADLSPNLSIITKIQMI
jgi:hypothetical protein